VSSEAATVSEATVLIPWRRFMLRHDKCAAFEAEIEILKKKIDVLSKENMSMKLFLSGLLMRSESSDPSDRGIVMSFDAEDQIINILNNGISP